MNPADRAIYTELQGTECACGAKKSQRQSFCRRDYFRLPVGTREALYDVDTYPETYRRAWELLGLQEPAARKAAAIAAAKAKEAA